MERRAHGGGHTEQMQTGLGELIWSAPGRYDTKYAAGRDGFQPFETKWSL